MYTGVHSDVSRESYSFELFDLPLDVPLVREINQGYMAYVSLWIPLIWGVKVLHNCICLPRLGLNLEDVLEDVFNLCMNVATQLQLYLTRHM